MKRRFGIAVSILLIIGLIIPSGIAYAAPPTEEWVARYNGPYFALKRLAH